MKFRKIRANPTTYSHRQAAEIVGLDDHEVFEWTRPTTGYFQPFRSGGGKGSRKEYIFRDLMFLKLLKTFKAASIAPGAIEPYFWLLGEKSKFNGLNKEFFEFVDTNPDTNFLKEDFVPEVDGYRHAWTFETVIKDSRDRHVDHARLLYRKVKMPAKDAAAVLPDPKVLGEAVASKPNYFEGKRNYEEQRKYEELGHVSDLTIVATLEFRLTRMHEGLKKAISQYGAEQFMNT